MSLKDDLKLVISELSPILAGFKLAVIIIGYFGLGSVAKWIISYWYPFTRWAWDQVAIKLSLPEFPLIIKDSLTALVFFVPLGVTAFIQKIKNNQGGEGHKVSSAIFGFLFLFLICKDVIGSIIDSITRSFEVFKFDDFAPGFDVKFGYIIMLYLSIVSMLFVIRVVSERPPYDKKRFFIVFRVVEKRVMYFFAKRRKLIFRVNLAFIFISAAIFSIFLISRAEAEEAYAILGAMTILVFIITSLLLAIFYSPKKLFITTGAAVAFVLAAAVFEGFTFAKAFMESVGSA